ncbi:hypothetical protein D0S45_07775 [Marinifilum sp. JC120]|nr:hypothetical protein D0S45_07775 [Marinifilum sp. JC120]
MHYKLKILATIMFLSVATTQSQATEIKQSNDLDIKHNSATHTSIIESRIDELAKPYDDIEVSDGISAGVISGRDDQIMENNHGLPTEEKGREVGVGISLSF